MANIQFPQLWNRMESNEGVDFVVQMFSYLTGVTLRARGEQEMPDRVLQLRMLEDALALCHRRCGSTTCDPGIQWCC